MPYEPKDTIAERDLAEIGDWLNQTLLTDVHISELSNPTNAIELYAKATRVVYYEEIEAVKAQLNQGTSVLVYAEQSAPYLMGWILEGKYEYASAGGKVQSVYWRVGAELSNGNSSGGRPSLPDRYLNSLQGCIEQWRRQQTIDGPFVIEDLDLMIGTGREQMPSQVDETLYALRLLSRQSKQNNYRIRLLAFADPRFGKLPEPIEEFFPKVVTLGGVKKERIWQILKDCTIVTRLFPNTGVLTIDQQHLLAKSLSTLNPIRAINILDACVNEQSGDTERKLERLCGGEDVVPHTREEDIAGYQMVKNEIAQKVIEPLRKRSQLLKSSGLADELIPKGILLYGPPGTGKTEIAKWIASSVGANMQHISGPELKSQFVGETERQIRSLFARARRSTPAVILIDEVDAMMPSRQVATQEYATSMVAQFLTEMDGLRSDEAITVIATTNLLEKIDPGFLRPGRFSLQIQIDYPNKDDIKAILLHYSDKFKLDNFDADKASERIWQSFYGNDPESRLVDETLKAAVKSGVVRPSQSKMLESYLLLPIRERALARQFPKLPNEAIRNMAAITVSHQRWSGDHLRAFCVEWLRIQQTGQDIDQDEVFETISKHFHLDISKSFHVVDGAARGGNREATDS